MDILTIFQELPDIKTISKDKEYLVVDKNDRPKITKKGKVNFKIRKVQHIKLVRETKTSYFLQFIPLIHNYFKLDLFGDPTLILISDFWNTFQVIEEIETERRFIERNHNNLIDELTAKTTIDELLGTEKNKKTPPTANQLIDQIADINKKERKNKK